MVEETNQNAVEATPVEEFLANVPPASDRLVSNAVYFDRSANRWYVEHPQLTLFCPDETCGGIRMFRQIGDPVSFGTMTRLDQNDPRNVFLNYVCSNCKTYRKIFSCQLAPYSGGAGYLIAYKYGEYPNFGPQIPARVFRIFQKNKDLF